MATRTGRAAVDQFFADVPAAVRSTLRGAAKAGANVIADEAKDRSISDEVTAAIVVKVRVEEDRIIGAVQVRGPGAYIAPWLEYGTDPHFISVDESQRGGRSIRRINELTKAGSLVIGGNFVGATVFHPGARPHPFLRPALDIKEAEAVARAQGYINARLTRAGLPINGGEE